MNDTLLTILLVIVISIIIITVLIYTLRKKPISNNNVDLAKDKNDGIVPDIGDNNNEFNLKKMTDMNEIIMNNDIGDQLSLVRTDIKEIGKTKFREIANVGSSVTSSTVQGAMPYLAQAQTIKEINRMAPKGLFTATAPQSTLMRFHSDGTYGSAVMKNGKIVKQSGFNKLNASDALSPVNPGAVIGASMQGMAAITGQYYMHQITSDLQSIKGEIDKLVSYHHDEKTAMLLTVKERLMKITEKENVDASDIIEIRQLHINTREVFNEYHLRLQRMDLDDLTIEKVNQLTKIKKMKELVQLISDKEINQTIQICFYADYLSLQCELAEISTRMKSASQTDQTALIKEKIQSLRKYYPNSFMSNVMDEVNKRYTPFLTNAELFNEKNRLERKLDKYYTNKIPEQIEEIKQSKKYLLENLPNKNNDAINQMLDDLDKPKQILYMLSEDLKEQRVFVAEEA